MMLVLAVKSGFLPQPLPRPAQSSCSQQLEKALQRALVTHDVKEYPDAGHSFMNNKEQFLFKLLRFSGIAYNEPATLDAQRRIAAFFHTHLGG
jgi:carboxymethylenebutenolidase